MTWTKTTSFNNLWGQCGRTCPIVVSYADTIRNMWSTKTGEIPLLKQVYPLLQKIGFGWESGFILHRGRDDTITFETNLDIAKYVCIPRAD